MSDKTQKGFTLKTEFEVKFTGNRVEHANFEHTLKAIQGLLPLGENVAIGLYVALMNNLMISNSGVLSVDLQNLKWEETDGKAG